MSNEQHKNLKPGGITGANGNEFNVNSLLDTVRQDQKVLTPKPATIKEIYYVRSKVMPHTFTWVLVTSEGIVHIKMPDEFYPPEGARLFVDFKDGHTHEKHNYT